MECPEARASMTRGLSFRMVVLSSSSASELSADPALRGDERRERAPNRAEKKHPFQCRCTGAMPQGAEGVVVLPPSF